jgi:hypothetical protein
MLSRLTRMRRALRGATIDERTGEVCTAACRALARRERDIDRALIRRGPR